MCIYTPFMTFNRDVNIILHHQRIYQYLQKEALYLMDLIHSKEHQTWAVLVHKVSSMFCYSYVMISQWLGQMQNIINHTCSDDASHLCPVISSYVAPHPSSKVLDPQVQPGTTKDRLGYNHPELACLLIPCVFLKRCWPVQLSEYKSSTKPGYMLIIHSYRTRKKITSGSIKVTTQKNPVFLYEGDISGKNFDPKDAASGFMHGYLLEHISNV